MKTTFDIPPPLLDQARKLAAQRKTSVKELVISGLRTVIAASASDERAFKLAKASVKGRGLQKPVQQLSATQLIEMSYERGNH